MWNLIYLILKFTLEYKTIIMNILCNKIIYILLFLLLLILLLKISEIFLLRRYAIHFYFATVGFSGCYYLTVSHAGVQILDIQEFLINVERIILLDI